MRKLVWWGLAAVIGYALVRSTPDVRRYLRIRAM